MDMTIGAISALASQEADGATATADAPGTGFAQLIERELADLNASTSSAETAMRDLAAGRPVELHEVMISLEKARISVQTFVQVRNKLVESYQDLMRMQM
jgi:flagellar hook-basal body complex protein FliE